MGNVPHFPNKCDSSILYLIWFFIDPSIHTCRSKEAFLEALFYGIGQFMFEAAKDIVVCTEQILLWGIYSVSYQLRCLNDKFLDV